MAKLFFTTLIFFLCVEINYPQWTNLNPVPNGNDLNSVFFIDDNTGWITGSDGFIIKTTNAGNDWVQQNSGTNVFLKSVKFVNLNTGWIVGDKGTIIKTTDGGQNWIFQSGGTIKNLNDLHFYDSNIGWAVGDSGIILRTTNGGNSWTSITINNITKLESVDFVNAFVGWAVGWSNTYPYGKILKTTDGGNNWTSIEDSLLKEYSLYCVEFIDENNGFIGGGLPRANFQAKTTDGGSSWNLITLPYGNLKENIHNYGTQDVYFKNENMGCIVQRIGDETVNIFRTSDGGSTWVRCTGVIAPIDNLIMSSIFITNAGQIWCVGVEGKIMMSNDNGNSFFENILTYRHSENSYQIINSVLFFDENNGLAGGYNRAPVTAAEFPLILKTTDGGKYWKRQIAYQDLLLPRVGDIIHELYFINQNFGWAIENTGLIATTDGGQTWTSRAILGTTDDDFHSLFFINPDTGWVVNSSNTTGIYKTTDGGYTWNLKNNQLTNSVYFVNSNYGWAVGPNGLILKSTDGGENWNTKTSGTSVNLNKVKFLDTNIGICVGDLGTTLFTTDGGESWISKNSGTTENLSSAFISNLNSIWAAGANGKILKTTNFGNTWTAFNGVTSDSIISIGFFNNYSGWAAGGSIFKYFDENINNQQPVWSNQINIEDAGNIESAAILTFGQHPDATDSIDFALGEYELPPPPVPGVFDSRFLLPTNPQVSSLLDLRDSTLADITWTMYFQPGVNGYPITFNWDSTSFPQGTFYLKDLIDGSFVFINMKNQGSYTLNNPAINSLNIRYRGNCSTVSVNNGWNMVSVPCNAEDMSLINLFPAAVPPAYGYDNSYYQEDTLTAGKGYWLKFTSNGQLQVCGSLAGQTVSVKQGWNLFGVYDNNISVNLITTTPPGIIATYFFGYNDGYFIADTLKSGKGYWVRVTEDGVINLNSADLQKDSKIIFFNEDDVNLGKIILTDNEGKSITLYLSDEERDMKFYELPPLPPSGIFDVRFASGSLLENLSSSKTILINSAKYPVTIKAEGINISLRDRINGQLLNAEIKSGEELKITDSRLTSIEITGEISDNIPVSFELYQNFPNPFNPGTTVKFSVPIQTNVNIGIYNILGELISTLVNEELKPGYYEYEFNASGLASGVYLYRIKAGNFAETKKMILLR